LASRLHEALIKDTHADRLVGHISRDSTAIEAREKPAKPEQPKEAAPQKRKRGRPRKDEIRLPEPPRRIERQLGMTLPEMLADLPQRCDVGTKRNAKGHTQPNSSSDHLSSRSTSASPRVCGSSDVPYSQATGDVGKDKSFRAGSHSPAPHVRPVGNCPPMVAASKVRAGGRRRWLAMPAAA
jgi:hypothetical protein